MRFRVCVQSHPAGELARTAGAFEDRFLCMGLHVLLQFGRLLKCLLAHIAGIGPFIGVGPDMSREIVGT